MAIGNSGDGGNLDISRVAVREPPPPKVKRFYRVVVVAADGGRHRVLLDNRPVRTPLKRILETPYRGIADAIAAEWQAQETEIDPAVMPVTRLVATCLDRVEPERAVITAALLAYVETDLLCYRAAAPASLKTRQERIWQPVLDWLAAHRGIDLAVTEGIVPVTQSPSALAAAQAALDALSAAHLTAVQAATGATGSLALALALAGGRITAHEAAAAAHLDETYQAEQWGADAEALERRRRIAMEIDAVGAYLSLIGAESES